MSDLQISLLIIGAAVVGAVYLFNRVQERKFRRSLGDAFDAPREDVLLRSAPAGDSRVEPSLQQIPVAAERANGDMDAAPDREAPAVGSIIDCVAGLEADAPIAGSVIAELLGRIAALGKPWRAIGLHADTGEWEDIAHGTDGRYAGVRVALQLVNRAGPLHAAQFAMFCDALTNGAARCSGTAKLPDTPVALEAARDLDAFCAEVDVAIGVNIVSAGGVPFQAARIRALAEAAGFRLEPDGVFRMRDHQRRVLFTLDNHEPAPFIPEQIQTLSTSGITLLLDVPLVENGIDAFDRMLAIGQELATALGGSLVDDNRATLNAPGIAKIRQQLGGIQATMESRGISAGGALASRLFA